MRNIHFITILAAMLLATPASAALESKACDQIDVKINGLVCDYCARALEKVFGKKEEVSAIRVDLDTGKVEITFKPGKTLDDATVTALITDSGYTPTTIDRSC